MKTNRNFWRIVTLALALVMLFSVVACNNEEEPAATTEAGADGSTQAPTTQKTTTETPTTSTTAPTTEPTQGTTATTEPTTEPTTELEAYSVVMPSEFDADGDGVNDSYTFSNKLPALFAGTGVVTLGCDDHLETDKGVGRTEGVKGSGVYHVYIDLSKEDVPHEEKTLTWEFEVAEAGTYEICFNMRMKDGKQRGNVMTIDGGAAMAMDFQFMNGAEVSVRDADLNSYMTGISVDLTAGKHTIQMKYNSLCEKTFHFRNIYIAKTNKVTVEMPSNFDNDNDGTNDSYTFSNYLPIRFGAADVIKLGCDDHLETDKGVGRTEGVKGSGVYHVYIDLSKEDVAHEEKTLTWKFNVPADGKYEFCFNMRMKDGKQRGNVMTIDGGKSINMDFQFNNGAEENVRDADLNSYMTGIFADLTAGEHTVVMTYQPLCEKTFHFRNIYLVKVAELTPAV